MSLTCPGKLPAFYVGSAYNGIYPKNAPEGYFKLYFRQKATGLCPKPAPELQPLTNLFLLEDLLGEHYLWGGGTIRTQTNRYALVLFHIETGDVQFSGLQFGRQAGQIFLARKERNYFTRNTVFIFRH